MGGPSPREMIMRRLIRSIARLMGVPVVQVDRTFERIEGMTIDQLEAERMKAIYDLYVAHFGEEVNVSISLTGYLERQRDWSRRTFGEGPRTKGISEHIRSELNEIEADPDDIKEWVDVIILALDGYWRAGGTPERIMADLQAKQLVNLRRRWPSEPPPQDEPSFHVKE